MEPSDTPNSPVLAYEDQTFPGSEDGRPLRLLAEYLGPLHRFRLANIHDTIMFFGSARLSSDGALGRYYQEARELARLASNAVVQEPSVARSSLRGMFRWRRRDHGSRQPRRL